jgi:tRNA-modifying protein YgfZ
VSDPATLVSALSSGGAFVDLSGWRAISVTGGDAWAWLNDLVSADVSGLRRGKARPSLLLTPTGRIRAAFTVAVHQESPLLIQDSAQPSVRDLLAPYVLSSDVALTDCKGALAIVAFPGRQDPPEGAGWPEVVVSRPSVAGAGLDLFAPGEDRDDLVRALTAGFAPATHADLDAWRVVAGVPRLGIDALPDDLPQEAGLADAVAFDKGCYLGQEAVARTRNLGHPRRLVLHLVAEALVSPGEEVAVDGSIVGEITGAVKSDGRWWVLARIHWDAREGPLRSTRGVPLVPAGDRSTASR